MEITTIASAISALKGASDLAKGLLGSKIDTAVQAKVIELNQLILEAQSQVFASRERLFEAEHQIRLLKEQIADLKSWKENTERYTLIYPWSNAASVYSLNESCSNGESPHYLCTACFTKKQKSILQEKKNPRGFCLMVCPICKAEISTGYRGIGPAKYTEAHKK